MNFTENEAKSSDLEPYKRIASRHPREGFYELIREYAKDEESAKRLWRVIKATSDVNRKRAGELDAAIKDVEEIRAALGGEDAIDILEGYRLLTKGDEEHGSNRQAT